MGTHIIPGILLTLCTHMIDQNAPRIMVVEDEISVSMELEEMLRENGYHVSGVVASGEEAIAKARQLKPDLILMDIKLSGELDGIDAAARIRSRMDIPSVFLTGHGEKELVDRAVKADPLGYVMKPLNEEQILAAVALALDKIDRGNRKHDELPHKNLPDIFLGFSARELQVASMIREGKENLEIAEQLGISKDTVNWHRKKIRNKLRITNDPVDLFVALRALDEG